MTQVYCKIHTGLADGMPNFFKKLKEFVGEFRFEQQPVEDVPKKVFTVSFQTDLEFSEGERREVVLEAKQVMGDWHFTTINKY